MSPHPTSPLILLVDDAPDVREMYAIELERAGLRVAHASDGRQAFATALEVRPDLVVSDVILPKLDGVELCRQLRSDERTRTIPVILLSGGLPPIEHLAGEPGMDAVLMKPCLPEALLAEIRRILGRSSP